MSSVQNQPLPSCIVSPDRKLTEAEQTMVWKAPASHRISEEERRISEEIKRNWHRGEMKIATILLEGDAGSGKTQLAKALSANLGLPYTKITCFADMDKSDVVGAILPVVSSSSASAGREIVEYRYYPSEIVTAFQHGYLLEIQEPTVIRDAGVLMALNSALEPDGCLNLPTGTIRRHPDFVAVITTNRHYAGCRPLNEALRDRVQHAEKMDLPSREVMVERTEAKTGWRNRPLLELLADIIITLDQTARANAIKGVAGMRSLFYWAEAVAAGASAGQTLYPKVIYKISTDPDDVKLLEQALAGRGMLAQLADAEREPARGPKRPEPPQTEEIQTSGDSNAEHEPLGEVDERAIALKKSPDSEDRSVDRAERSGDAASDDLGADGAPFYRPEQPEETPAQKQQRERDFRKQRNREARAAVNGSMHQGVKLVVHRPGFEARDVEAYERLCAELVPVIRETARNVLPLLSHDVAADFAGNRLYGGKFQAERAAYRDYRYFAKKLPPSESPSLAVGLRIDESASMTAEGRLEAAKRAAVAVCEFCRLCDIPLLVYGDTADVSRLEQMSIYAYADYDKPDPDDRFKLMGIRARGNNRDGMALRIMADKLAGAPQQTKLLISVSDGQPKAMDDYAGSRAIADMKQTIAEYERKGVTFLSAAIGQDKEIIGDIYGGERFLDIADLRQFPAQLIRAISRYL
ncbi:AAA family ATPase [Paenibacillus cymbidii]|uniref:AAA family ATPase n=1 Tax=Paenibacillus cymbidii TaxID=1639034 RepID=UPI0010814D93|nr:AAA family ATPase [Paenibacillus cymbidii]